MRGRIDFSVLPFRPRPQCFKGSELLQFEGEISDFVCKLGYTPRTAALTGFEPTGITVSNFPLLSL
jgi:hypothetical protein